MRQYFKNKKNILYKTLKYLYEIYWIIIPVYWRFKTLSLKKEINFTIGVVTYVDRYEKIFLPFLNSLLKLFPDVNINIAVNGYYDQHIQKKYLQDINAYFSKYNNVTIISYEKPQSLSKLWNILIINSQKNKILILNDDLKISPFFRKFIFKKDFLNNELALINSSWSHFLISKEIIKVNGWFDERLEEVGYEDADFELRLNLNNKYVKNFNTYSVKNIMYMTKKFSYDNDIQNLHSDKYRKKNFEFYNKKWAVIDFYKEDYITSRFSPNHYFKLNEDYITPEFYSLEVLNRFEIIK